MNFQSYDEKITAFIDILGFKELILDLEKRPDLHKQIHRALEYLKHYKNIAGDETTTLRDLKISMFSDSLAVSAPCDKFLDVIWACGWLSAQLLYIGILTRGGIAKGNMVHQDDFLYGRGLIDAYEIESKVANYPRIVLAPELLERITPQVKNFLRADADGLWFINSFKFEAMPGGAQELASDGWNPREIYFKEVQKHIQNGLRNSKNLNHFSKWAWLSAQMTLEQI